MLAVGLIQFTDHIGRQLWNVQLPLPQGRDIDGEDGKAVEQVIPEGARRHGLPKIPVGGGDDPDIDLDRLTAAHPGELLLLEHPQQLGLQVQGELADLV